MFEYFPVWILFINFMNLIELLFNARNKKNRKDEDGSFVTTFMWLVLYQSQLVNCFCNMNEYFMFV